MAIFLVKMGIDEIWGDHIFRPKKRFTTSQVTGDYQTRKSKINLSDNTSDHILCYPIVVLISLEPRSIGNSTWYIPPCSHCGDIPRKFFQANQVPLISTNRSDPSYSHSINSTGNIRFERNVLLPIFQSSNVFKPTFKKGALRLSFQSIQHDSGVRELRCAHLAREPNRIETANLIGICIYIYI